MSNSIDIRVVFSYKGETHSPMAHIDLDALLDANGSMPDLYPLLARANGIDTYSYLYEVMESSEVEFLNATGIAAQCLHDGVFDAVTFEQLWAEEKILALLQPIAHHYLQIEDLAQHPDLKDALLAAYNAGKAND